MYDKLNEREIGNSPRVPIIDDFLDEEELMRKLHVSDVFKGHDGCVNCLRWNEAGTMLVSGSDDKKAIVWRGDGRELHRVDTCHMGNVFAVDFMPKTGDRTIVTGAADHMLMIHDVEEGQQFIWHTKGRVKRISTSQEEPWLFWSACEDGLVREIDTRNNEVNELISMHGLGAGIKSISVCQSNSNLVALALERTFVPLFDRRFPKNPFVKLCPTDACSNSAFGYVTHVAFNYQGTECVVNQGGGGGVLVYDVNKTNDVLYLQQIDDLLSSECEQASPIVADKLPYADIRKRGSSFIQEKNYNQAIEFYSRQLSKGYAEKELLSVFHSNRALAYLCRRQKGDTYACIRDCLKALKIHGGNTKALWRMCKAFLTLEQWAYARRCCDQFHSRFPNETSINRLQKELDRISTDGCCEAQESEALTTRPDCIDYKERYNGHLNCQTDIKEANFFGSREEFIVSGSDCGSLIIWERKCGTLLGAWECDRQILNIVQPHPTMCKLATSGIDNEIRVWQPELHPEKIEEEIDPWDFLLRKQATSDNYLSLGMLTGRFLRRDPNCVTS